MLSYSDRIKLPLEPVAKNNQKAVLFSTTIEEKGFRFKLIVSNIIGYPSVEAFKEGDDVTIRAYLESLLEEYQDIPKLDMVIHFTSLNNHHNDTLFVSKDVGFQKFMEEREDDLGVCPDGATLKEWAIIILKEWKMEQKRLEYED